MFRTATKKLFLAALALVTAFGVLVAPTPQTQAADHGDAPFVGENPQFDINDVYFFLDPNDNNRAVIAFTVRGFIVPSEAVNFGLFDPASRFRIEIENTGDTRADSFIDIRFSAKRTSSSSAQTATVTLPGNRTFTAPTTVPTTATTAPTPMVTTDSASGALFFAGVVDDPFFFDIPAFGRFVTSVINQAPDVKQFDRARDSFAGYNTLAVAIAVPSSVLGAADTIGVDVLAQRQTKSIFRNGEFVGKGDFVTIDRMGNPAINVALIPFGKKNSYNFSTTQDDGAGKFAPDIVATLKALGTNDANVGILAGVAVSKGDFLHLKKSVRNTGTGGGTNAEAGFPNGRRLGDDVIDTILFFVANQNKLGDNVNSNDGSFRDTFPFFAASQQPREGTGNIDDNTRN